MPMLCSESASPRPSRMDKSTKYCELSIRLTSGLHVTGKFHTSMRTGSTIRPSDELRKRKDGYILLTDVVTHDGRDEHQANSLMIPTSAVDYIELPERNWTASQTTSPVMSACTT